MTAAEQRRFSNRMTSRGVRVRIERNVELDVFHYRVERSQDVAAGCEWELLIPRVPLLRLSADLASAEIDFLRRKPRLSSSYRSRAFAFRRVILSKPALSRLSRYEIEPEGSGDPSATVKEFGYGRQQSIVFDVIKGQAALHEEAGGEPNATDPVARRASRAGLGKLWLKEPSHLKVVTGREFEDLLIGLERARLLEPEPEAPGEVVRFDQREMPVRLALVAELDAELETALGSIAQRIHDPDQVIEDLVGWRTELTRARQVLARVRENYDLVLLADHREATRWHAQFATSLLREATRDPGASIDLLHGRALLRSVMGPKRLTRMPVQPLRGLAGSILARAVEAALAAE
jgi:hypothetical protein